MFIVFALKNKVREHNQCVLSLLFSELAILEKAP